MLYLAQVDITRKWTGSLTDDQADYYAEMFKCPELILRTGNGFLAVKIEG